MSKKGKKEAKNRVSICPYCQYDCRDKESLDRHIEWTHKKERAGITRCLVTVTTNTLRHS